MTCRGAPNGKSSVDRNVIPHAAGWYATLARQAAVEELLRPLTIFSCLLVAACTQNAVVPPTVQPTAARRGDTGTILSMRPVSGHYGQEPVIETFRIGSGVTNIPENAALEEFIVRADDGATLSIVQPNDLKFHAGQRVAILHAEATRLAPSN